MKDYEKPVVKINDYIGEGVYAASGADGETSTDCWTVDAVSVQDWDGAFHVFEIRCVHSTEVVHISSNTEVTLVFSATLTNARSEFPCSFSGDTVTVNRELHANAYKSGDTMTYKVWVDAGDEALTKGISCTYAGITCTHQPNVPGGFD